MIVTAPRGSAAHSDLHHPRADLDMETLLRSWYKAPMIRSLTPRVEVSDFLKLSEQVSKELIVVAEAADERRLARDNSMQQFS